MKIFKQKLINTKQKWLKRLAFTLAEVLICLGIIGVVAEVTIPNLIIKYEKVTTISQLKKTYSMLQTIQMRAIAEYGTVDSWGLVAQQDYNAMAQVYQNIFAPMLQVAKYCGPSWDAQPQCWAYGCDIQGGNCSNVPDYGCVYTVLADGTAMVFEDATAIISGVTHYRMLIYVDLNGNKKPNKLGKDRFVFRANDDPEEHGKLEPFGSNFYAHNRAGKEECWTPTSNAMNYQAFGGVGTTCAYNIINLDNWELTTENPYWK